MAAIATVTSYEYATDSCTLRLVGELSPLSQVTGRPVLGRSRFHLQVHGGNTPGETRSAANQAVIFEASGREPQFSALAELVQTYVQRHLSADALAAGGAVSMGESSLQPVGLTRHRLTLAAHPEPARVVELSTLQLSDLADALEQADSNLQILPDAAMPRARRRPRLPLWLGSVAAVGIAALLGNQLLTTAPSSVVLSPSESQTADQSGSPPSPQSSGDRQLTPQTPKEPAPDASGAVPAQPATTTAGEALPAPVTTAPTTPAVPPRGSAGSPKASPPPAAGAPAPAPNTTPRSDRLAPSSEAQSEAQAEEGVADSSANTAPAPTAPSPEALRTAPAGPESFDAGPSIAASSAPSAALTELSNLTQALQQQWRPPANLAAPLRYRLTLEPDGTVTAVEPLNDFSATYQNTPTLPQPGTSIPGVVSDAVTSVEVQFLPSGEVVVVPPDPPKP